MADKDVQVTIEKIKEEATNAAKEITNSFLDWSNITKTISTDFFELGKSLETVGIKAIMMTDALRTFSGAKTAFGDFAREGQDMAARITESFKATATVLEQFGKSGQGLAKYLTGISESAQRAQDFEMGMLKMSAATGDFSKMMSDAGSNLERMDDIARAFGARSAVVAQATASTSEEVFKLRNELRDLGGKSDQTVQFGSKTMDSLTAVISVSKGSLQSVDSVAKRIASFYRDYNKDLQSTLTYTSQLRTTTDVLKTIPFDLIEQAANGISESFKDWGDNTGAALRIIQQVGPALQAANVPASKMADLFKSMSAGINNMSVAQKAFLSQQGGGPGGLQGAVRIENLIRAGKTDEVMKMAEDALRKRFGKIVTSDEAEKSQGAANEFIKQREFLKSGAFGGMVKNDADATRMLEAMSKGKLFDQSRTEEAGASERLTEQRADAIIKYNTSLATLNDETRKLSGMFRSISDRGIGAELIGTGGQYKKQVEDRMFGARTNYEHTRMTGMSKTSGDTMVVNSFTDYMKGMKNIAESAFSNTGRMFSQEFEKLSAQYNDAVEKRKKAGAINSDADKEFEKTKEFLENKRAELTERVTKFARGTKESKQEELRDAAASSLGYRANSRAVYAASPATEKPKPEREEKQAPGREVETKPVNINVIGACPSCHQKFSVQQHRIGATDQ